MPGPLPQTTRRRRNAPTIPTSVLPAAGRPGRAPKPPAWMDFGPSGLAWWAWAWHTPQAAAWSLGHEVTVARRAQLEDDLAALAEVDSLDLLDVLEEEVPAKVATKVKVLIVRLAALCSGRLGVLREMRELDDRLGLTPKSMAALRWTIEEDETPGLSVAPPIDIDRWKATGA